MKKKTNKASVRNIARAAGVSPMAASFALKNQAGVSPKTRERILRIAKKLGYAPDAGLSNLMAQVRLTTSHDLLPIAWLNTSHEKHAWTRYRFHTPYLDGARARAQELGYKIEEIWAHEPGLSMRRLSRMLYQRGIEGCIITHPALHLRLNWDRLACVTLGGGMLAPRLHRVSADLNFNLLLTLKSLKRLGYRRIGICLVQELESPTHGALRATARDLYFSASAKDRIPPLFHKKIIYPENNDGEKAGKIREVAVVKWLKRHKPEVIVGHDNRLKEWIESAGYRVPKDVGISLLAVDDDVLDWAGIHSRRRETGSTAIEWLVSLMRNRQYGVPKTPLTILIPGTWQTGKTLSPLIPRLSPQTAMA